VTSPPPAAETYAKLLPENPHIRYFDTGRCGYVSADVTAERMTARYQVVSDVTDPAASVSTQKCFVVENGCPGAVAA
jgi:alkaline phosphatase D